MFIVIGVYTVPEITTALCGGIRVWPKELDTVYAVEVQDVHKKFKIYYDKGRTLKERLLFRNRNRSEERWVLRGIDFKVKKGEAIGLIGENGAGKSTMLKLMTRIIYPDQGNIIMRGRVSSLIELGAGFHPDMSGRENIYTNAAIFGITRKEIDARLQDIIDFSELEEFFVTLCAPILLGCICVWPLLWLLM